MVRLLNSKEETMTGIRQKMACTATLVLICVGTTAVNSGAQSSTAIVADDAVKKSQNPVGGLTREVPGPPVGGEFQSAPTLFRLGKFADAERQFAWIAAVRKGTTWGERSQYYLAECQYQQKRYAEALESFERLHTDYPQTDYRDQLVRREYEIAQRFITWAAPVVVTAKKKKEFLLALFDHWPPMANTDGLALSALSAVRFHDPSGPLAENATIKIADYYMKNCDYKTAAAYYDQFIAEYPKSPHCPHARLAAVEARFRIYYLDQRDNAGLTMARELAKLFLRAFLNFGDHAGGH
jgi:TolA-binding protein